MIIQIAVNQEWIFALCDNGVVLKRYVNGSLDTWHEVHTPDNLIKKEKVKKPKKIIKKK